MRFGVALATALASCILFAVANAEPITVRSKRIPLYPDRPNELRAGSLTYRGGLELSSTSTRFGGLSDLAVSADGGDVLSVSDAGRWFKARLSYDVRGNLAGLTAGDIAPLLDDQGKPLGSGLTDSEGLTLERANDLDGPVIVSFERVPRLLRYDLAQGFTARPTSIPVGDWVNRLHDNQQLEAVTLWKKDTVLVFAETKVNPGDDILGALEAYPGDQRPHTRMLSVVPHDPFAITSAANAPDGGIYLLERRFSLAGGVGMELRHIPATEIHEGARLNGEVLANLSFLDANIDNMEGVAVRIGSRGETLLYIISDDNFSPLQRTLLLMFEVRK